MSWVACLASSEQSNLEDSTSWADLMRRSASRIWRESSSWTVLSSSAMAEWRWNGIFYPNRETSL